MGRGLFPTENTQGQWKITESCSLKTEEAELSELFIHHQLQGRKSVKVLFFLVLGVADVQTLNTETLVQGSCTGLGFI